MTKNQRLQRDGLARAFDLDGNLMANRSIGYRAVGWLYSLGNGYRPIVTHEDNEQ